MFALLALLAGGWDGFEADMARIRAEHKLPAIGAAFVTERGEPNIWVTGVRREGSKEPVQKNDVWHLGSNGKAMTAALVTMLSAERKLSLDTSLSKLFAPAEPYADRTLRHLLAMRAGIRPNLEWTETPSGVSLLEHRRAFARQAMALAPGKDAYEYSNTSYFLAGLAAENATNTPLETLFEKRLFEPLGLRSAAFGPNPEGQPWPHDAKGPSQGALDNPPVITAAGRIRMNLRDWGVFAQEVLRGMNGMPSKLPRLYFQEIESRPLGGNYAMGWNLGNRRWSPGLILSHAGSNTMNFCVDLDCPEAWPSLAGGDQLGQGIGLRCVGSGGGRDDSPVGKIVLGPGTPAPIASVWGFIGSHRTLRGESQR